jgi:hypothetical protein
VLHHGVDGVPHGRTICDIARDGQDAGTAANPRLRANQLFAISRQQRDACTLFPDLTRHQQAQPARSTCDDDDSAGIGEAIASTSQFHWGFSLSKGCTTYSNGLDFAYTSA